LAKSKKVVLKSRGMDRECHNQLISTYNQELKKNTSNLIYVVGELFQWLIASLINIKEVNLE
jgi:hypothetical protein